ncbi:MAG: hypothetical protein MJ223_01040 [Mycoplasmoidaceae bacterium]|nr:hypothetical protein [Mycoplasmoidaceae bacterium]
MPANSRNIAADSYTQIINEVGKRVYEVQDLFINDPSLQCYVSSDYPDCIQASSSQYSTVKALVDEVVAKYGDNK